MVHSKQLKSRADSLSHLYASTSLNIIQVPRTFLVVLFLTKSMFYAFSHSAGKKKYLKARAELTRNHLDMSSNFKSKGYQ